jgi:phage tail sheath protein FI
MVSATFYHGAEVRIQQVGSRPITNDNVAVIGLIGSAPMFQVDAADRSLNEPIQILNRSQAAQFFGTDVEGFTIPRALDGIFDQVDFFGGVKVLVINVLDFETPKVCTPATENGVTFTTDTYDVGSGVCTMAIQKDFGGSTGIAPLVEGTDYTVDYANGVITIIPESEDFDVGDTVDLSYETASGGNQSTITSEAHTFSISDTIQLVPGIVSLTLTGTGGTPTYVEDTDYVVDTNTGLVTRLQTGSITFQGDVEATYTYVDGTTVSDAQIIGGVDGDGNRSGLEAFRDSFNLYGYMPKIIISPEFSDSNNVTAAMETTAVNLDCMAVVDAPIGTTYNEAISGRGVNGTINFNYQSERLIGLYPHLQVFRIATDRVELEPSSTRFSGAWANSIIQRGFWWSPSNINLRGVQGIEVKLEYIPGNASTEANQLNASGITTVINYYGAGFRTWGNRSFLFPNDTQVRNFIAVKFSEIVIHEAIVRFAQNYVDYPINAALIDTIEDGSNAYMRTLINAGGLIDGSRVYYDPADNPPENIANGNLTLRIDMLPPPPAERITFLSFLNIQLANNLNVGRELVGVN